MKESIHSDDLQNNRKFFKYKNLTPLWIAVFIDILGFSLIIPLAPYLQVIFNATTFIIGIVMSVNAMFSFVFGPILGKLSDKFGRRSLLLISQAGTFVGFLIFAFSNSLVLLVISRIIDGVFGGNFPIAKAVISDEVPPKERGFQMANIGVAHVLASLIGPGLGGLLFSIGGIIAPGLFAAGLSLLTMVLTILFLNETWPKSKRLHHKKISMSSNEKIKNNRKAVLLLVIWGFHTSSFTIAMVSISFIGALVLGLSAFEIGLLLMLSGSIRATIRFTAFKPTVKKLGERNAIKFGLVMFSVTFFLLGIVFHPLMLLILLLLISFAASITRGPMNSQISQSVSPKIQGKINGYSSALDSFAQIIGPLIVTSMLQFYTSFWLGVIMCTISLPAMALMFFCTNGQSFQQEKLEIQK